MPEALSLADLPPDVAEQVVKRLRIRLRPPLPPELSWESDADQPGDTPPTEAVDVEFSGRGRGEQVQPVDRPGIPQLACEVPADGDREGDQ